MDDRLIAQIDATAHSLREAASIAQQELEEAQRERAVVEARIEQLGALLEQLNSAVSDAETTVASGTGTQSSRSPAPARRKRATKKASRKKATSKRAATKRATRAGAGRSSAIVEVLGRVGEPMRPAQIAEQLRGAGRQDTSSQVSAALAQLARAGRVTRAGEGLYAPADAAGSGSGEARASSDRSERS